MSKGVSLNTVVATLKACVISNPNGVEENHLNGEYKQLMGSGIPFKELGFASLSDLIKASGSLNIVNKNGRRLVVVEDSKADHVSSLISKQKKPTANKKKRPSNKFQMQRLQPLPSRYGNTPRRGGGRRGGRGGFRGSYSCGPAVSHVSYRPAGSSSSCSNSPPEYVGASSRSTPKVDPPPPSKPPSRKALIEPLLPTPPQPLPVARPPLLPTPLFPSPQLPSPSLPKRPPLLPTPSLLPNVADPSTLKVTIFKDGTRATDDSNLPPVSSNKAQMRLNQTDPVMPPRIPVASRDFKTSKSGNRLATIKDDSVPQAGSYCERFVKLVRDHDWPDPTYTYLPRILLPQKIEVFGCMVDGSYSINNNDNPISFHFSTLPTEYKEKFLSKEAVSEKAYKEMVKTLEQAADYVPVSDNPETIISRVYDMVSEHPNGLWAYKVEKDYKIKYKERLPPAWYDLIASSGILIAEKLADFSHVIRPAPQNLDGTIISVDEGSINMDLPDLLLPETEYWDIFVTKVVSSNQIWFRFVGPEYSDLCARMLELMSAHYSDWSALVAPTLEIGSLYAYPGPQVTARVELLGFESDYAAIVRYIDHGDLEHIPKSHLCILDFNFRDLAAQAIQCQLKDLEYLEDDRLATSLLVDRLEGQVLVAERSDNEGLLELIVYDTSGEDPVNLNNLILSSLDYSILEPPELPETNEVREVTVCCIRNSGEIFVQVPGEGLNFVTTKLSELGDLSLDAYLTEMPSGRMEEMLYIVQFNSSWHRVSILPSQSDNVSYLDALLIDTGEMTSVSPTQLVPLASISLVLCDIPPQAIEILLSNVNLNTERLIKRVRELVNPPSNAIAKVVLCDVVPSVQLFIREPVSNALISVNETLIVETPFLASVVSQLSSLSLQPKVSVPEEFCTIKPAKTPQIGDDFDVFIVSVSNPSNFVVIPLKYVNKITELQEKMSHFYKSLPPGSYRLANYRIGQACAVMHSDDVWYRGLIQQVVDRSMSQLMIRFCDFGNLAMIPSDRLRVLDKQFFILPGLGFNACIADICPIFKDWNLEDCERAQMLLLEKSLVSIIKDIREEEGQRVLSLQLFDTSTDDDRDIGAQLVLESRAKFIHS